MCPSVNCDCQFPRKKKRESSISSFLASTPCFTIGLTAKSGNPSSTKEEAKVEAAILELQDKS